MYADQGNWPAAQTAYFQAHHLARANPDYAFNLAVSLEHLSQPKLALNFYQQALELNDQVPLYMGAEEYGRYATEQTAREKVFVQELGIKLD